MSVAVAPAASVNSGGFPDVVTRVKSFFNDRANFTLLLSLALFAELVLGVLIINYVKYTEIDWIAYMQEVKGVIDGDLNYANLRGDTGPLVYPAGFVWIYTALYYATDLGTNILRAQYIFLAIYLAITAVAATVLHRSRVVPQWLIATIFVSKRIHSIFMLRCFNDGIAMLLLYIAVLLFIANRWNLGCAMYSLAVSVKMNVLLFAPGLLLLLWQRFGFLATIPRLALCAAIQVALAAPFIATYPIQYFHGAFDFGRVFQYVWTVNFRFIPEHVFVSKPLALGLLSLQLLLLAAFFTFRERRHGGIVGVFKRSLAGPLVGGARGKDAVAVKAVGSAAAPAAVANLAPEWIVSGLFVSNFIGIVCARSLHYQFYVWYFHTLPFLFARAQIPTSLKLVGLLMVERAWNTFPSTVTSSLMLLAVHVVLLIQQFVAESEVPLPTLPNEAAPAVAAVSAGAKSKARSAARKAA